jgi:hypothetical protein
MDSRIMMTINKHDVNVEKIIMGEKGSRRGGRDDNGVGT